MTRFSSIASLDEVLSRMPCAPFRRRAFRRIAAAHLSARRYDEADALLSKALGAYPRDAGLLESHALSANDRGLFAEALERWQSALAADPTRSLPWCGVAANLRSLRETERAQATIDEALDRFPGDATVLVEAARIASTRGDHARALGLWDRAIAAGDPHPDWLFHRADTLLKLTRFAEAATAVEALGATTPGYPGLQDYALALRRIRRHLEDRQDVPAREAVAAGMTAISPDALFAKFEGLGDNCEFGLVQRYNHIEPLGLFRFAWSTTDGLIDVLSRRLADFGVEGDLELVVNETDASYDCRSIKHRDFRYHTEMFVGQIEPDALLRRELTKVAYLKKRMLSDLADADKIFVRKGGGRIEEGIALLRVLRRFGPVTLLWVDLADDEHPPGNVERVEEGLLRGYISRFAPYGNAHDIDLLCWAELCRTALALRSGTAEPPLYVAEPNTIHRMGLNWAFTPACTAQDVAAPAFPGLTTQRLTLVTDTTRDDAILAARLIDFELAPRALVVFSLWIWLPEAFRGSFVDVFVSNGPSFVSMADLRRRDAWQRVWTSARLPKGHSNVAVGLRVTGVAGDSVFVGGWRLESGSLPDDWSLEPHDPPAAASRLDDGHGDRLGTEAL